VEAVGQQAAGAAVFQPVQHLAQDAEAGRHQAAGVAGVHALGQDLDLQHAGDHATQAGGEPQLVVVAGAGIEADDQADLAQARAQQVQVGRQVEGAAFLAALDQADDARVRQALRLQRLDGGDGSVDGVAVVGTAAAVEQAVLVLRRPGPEVIAPAVELGLLVEVAVHHDGSGGHRPGVAAAGGRQLEEDHRGAAFEADHLQLQARHLAGLDPGGGVAHHAVDQAMGLPVRVEHRALGRHRDVVGQGGDDGLVPAAGGKGAQGAGFVGMQRQLRIARVHGACGSTSIGVSAPACGRTVRPTWALRALRTEGLGAPGRPGGRGSRRV
jgi:hypothetical protein